MTRPTYNVLNHEAYRAAFEKLQQLRADHAAAVKKHGEALQKLSLSPSRSRFSEQVLSLLGVSSMPDQIDPKEVEELGVKVQALNEAIRIQNGIVEKARFEASKEIALQALPAHKRNVEAIYKALIALRAAAVAEKNLRDELEAGSISYLSWIRPMGLTGTICNTDDLIYSIDAFEKEALEFNLIARKSTIAA